MTGCCGVVLPREVPEEVPEAELCEELARLLEDRVVFASCEDVFELKRIVLWHEESTQIVIIVSIDAVWNDKFHDKSALM